MLEPVNEEDNFPKELCQTIMKLIGRNKSGDLSEYHPQA